VPRNRLEDITGVDRLPFGCDGPYVIERLLNGHLRLQADELRGHDPTRRPSLVTELPFDLLTNLITDSRQKAMAFMIAHPPNDVHAFVRGEAFQDRGRELRRELLADHRAPPKIRAVA
jgi:hypothetical protein